MEGRRTSLPKGNSCVSGALWMASEAVRTGPVKILETVLVNDLAIRPIVSPYCAQNSYLIEHPRSGSALVVDAGVGTANAIQTLLAASRSTPRYILLTHEHFDHIGNLNELRAAYPCPVVAARPCSENLPDCKRNLSAFLLTGQSYASAPAEVVVDEERESIPWEGPPLTLLAAPGHTSGSLCIHMPGVLFTGDTMIWMERTVVNLPGGSREHLQATLDRLFSALPGETVVLAGHGPVFHLSETTPSRHLGPLAGDSKMPRTIHGAVMGGRNG